MSDSTPAAPQPPAPQMPAIPLVTPQISTLKHSADGAGTTTRETFTKVADTH